MLARHFAATLFHECFRLLAAAFFMLSDAAYIYI